MESPKNDVYVSSISIWEVIIKSQIGKLTIPKKFEISIDAQGFTLLEFKSEHSFEILNLPLHHRDPFDRALLAQARAENFVLLTSDLQLTKYKDQVKIRMME